MRATLESARLAARSDSIVLLMGESGSGKDYVAKYLHENSPRSGGPFFTINCAALPPELAESELFGHEPGAFSGAKGRKRGLLELAEGGTLLLNEIGELALTLQAKLLTFLDTQSFTRVGGERSTTVNARLLAATNRDLEKEVAEGRFRQDLFYRINVICITVPPLRERVDDLPILVRDLTAGLCKKLGFVEPPLIHQKCLEIFMAYKWPGNVRELKNVLERALILSQGREIDPHAIGFPLDQAGPTSDDSLVVKKSTDQTFNDILCAVKRNLIEEALRRSGGNRTRAASMLGLSRYALKHYIKALAIE
jgi:transcriptional regulator with PAS, ATPase and Fis domain